MKTLVTGGAGFIGSHIVDGLLAKGHSVRVLDNLSSTGDKRNLAQAKKAGKRFHCLVGDIQDPDTVREAVAGCDVVFHLAALRSVARSIDNPFSTNEVNITATLRLLAACKSAGVKRVVFASSSSVYGDNMTYPQTESMRTAPISPYAVSKLAGEQYNIVYSKIFGLETVSLRYFNVFGPRQSPESQYSAVIPKFMEAAFRGKALEVHWDGRQSRDFTYIDNVVQANLLAAQKPRVAGEYFNIATGKNYSLLDIVKVLEKLAGHSLKIKRTPARRGDVRKTWADIRKAKQLLGYKPTVGFDEGLARTWQWFVRTQSV